MRAGDLVLTHRNTLASRLIAWGQGRREKRYRWATHAAIAISDTEIVEALSRGVVRSPILKYAVIPHRIVALPSDDEAARRRVVDYALAQVGRRYGWLEDVSLALYCLTGTRLRFVAGGQLICSALAAEAWSRVVLWPFEPLFAMPADLARELHVQAP